MVVAAGRNEEVIGRADELSAIDRLCERAAERLPGPQRQALEVAFLRADPEGVVADQRALSVATRGLVRLLADEAPLLLAVDDVQWLDESSAAILAYVARRLHGCRAATLLTLRAGPSRIRWGSRRLSPPTFSSGDPSVHSRSLRCIGCSRRGSSARSRASSWPRRRAA